MIQITPWERSALELLAAGICPAQIGLRSSLSQSEVERRLAALFAKMGAASQAEAVAAASRRGLLRDSQFLDGIIPDARDPATSPV